MMQRALQVAYVEGRPGSHPAHAAYARSVNAVFHHVDFRLRYHDHAEPSRLRRYLSWLLSAFTFPERRRYDVFLSEEAYFMLGLMKQFGLISRKKKLISMMGSHTLYFLHTNRYSPTTRQAFIRLFKQYDAFICEGPIQYELLNNFLGSQHRVKLFRIFNGSPRQRFEKLMKVNPELGGHNIVTIGAIPNADRIHYKGIDLMLQAFALAKKTHPNLTFTVVGDFDRRLALDLLQEHCRDFTHDVFFTGRSEDLCVELKSAALYLHTARGEAWGISVTEAMNAGVPAMVSDWTGSKEVVEKVSPGFVLPLDAASIAQKIVWYFHQPLEERARLSEKAREVSSFYTEENAVENFRKVFYEACSS